MASRREPKAVQFTLRRSVPMKCSLSLSSTKAPVYLRTRSRLVPASASSTCEPDSGLCMATPSSSAYGMERRVVWRHASPYLSSLLRLHRVRGDASGGGFPKNTYESEEHTSELQSHLNLVC